MGEVLRVAVAVPPSEKDIGTIQVGLVDGAGGAKASLKRDVPLAREWTTHLFEFGVKPAAKDQIRVEWDGAALVAALEELLLKAPAEASVRAGLQWHPGSSVPVDVTVTAPVALDRNPPIPGVEVVAELVANGKATRLARGQTGSSGRSALTLAVPELEPGQYA